MTSPEARLAAARALSAEGDALAREGRIAPAVERWSLALEAVRDAMRDAPETGGARHLEATLRCARGSAYLQMGDAARAAADLRNLPVDSLTGPVLYNRGIAFFFVGDYDGAIADLQPIIQAEPANRMARSLRGRARARKECYEDAVEDLTAALAAGPGAEEFSWRGLALQRLGRHREAVADFDAAARLDPRDADTFANRARSRLELHDFPGAVADLDESLRLRPDALDVLLERGNARWRAGDARGAAGDVERALRLAPPGWEYRATAERILASLR